MKQLVAAAVFLAALAGGPAISHVVPRPGSVIAALGDPGRPKDDVASDALRDPADTLAFAGVKPGMVVGELFPGGGYFTLDHQANPGTTIEQIAVLHRIEKAQVIKEVTAAGFRLAAEGKFLNRPDDDHTKTIFDASIRGKTDQYMLKFIKPEA